MPDNFVHFGDLLPFIASQRLLVIYEDEPVSPEDADKFKDKYVIDVRALQFPEGDLGLGIALSDTIIFMPDLRGLFGGNNE